MDFLGALAVPSRSQIASCARRRPKSRAVMRARFFEFFAEVYQDKSRPDLVRLAAADRLLDRALGRPTSSSALLETDASEATHAHVYRFSWLPPDPTITRW